MENLIAKFTMSEDLAKQRQVKAIKYENMVLENMALLHAKPK